MSADLQMHYAALDREISAVFESEQVPFLSAMVEAPSHTYAKDDVEQCFALYDGFMADGLGLHIERIADSSGRFADHRIYRTKAAVAGEKSIALVGHMDTVFPRSMEFLHYRQENGNAYGPGSLDMKSGLGCIAYALLALRKVLGDGFQRLPICVICVSDEEVGSPSSSDVVYDVVAENLRAALVFEAGRTDDEIVTSRKGSLAYTVTAHGVSAHAGNHHADGTNAIHAMSLLIPRLEGLTNYDTGTTCNVGLIKGGTAKNTIPDFAEIKIDVRAISLEEARNFGARLTAAVEETKANLPASIAGATFEISGGISRSPMEPTQAHQDLRLAYEVQAKRVGLNTGEAPLQGGGSDANLLSALGVPSIDGLGPYGRHFHKKEEWCSLSSLEKRTKALAGYLVSCDFV